MFSDTFQIEFGRRRLPMLLQTEGAECGLACLAMVASHHGFRTDLTAMRARFRLSFKGANLEQIISYADRLHLSARVLRLELEELHDLKLPCILHWNLNHFVVLKSVGAKGAVIHDPAVGVRRLSLTEIDGHFTGIALELMPTSAFKPANEQRKVSLASILGSVSGLWQGLGVVFIMALALEAFALLGPMLNQWVVDEALVAADRSLLNVLAFGALLLMITQSAVSQARGWTVMYLSTHLNLQWVSNVFSHLLRLPVAWFEKRQLGDVISRFGSIGAIQRTLTTSFIGAVLDGLMAVITFGMMVIYSLKLSIVVIATVIAYALIRIISYHPLREASVEGLALTAKEQTCFLETVRAVRAIKLFGRELDRRARWLNLMVDSVNRGVRTQKLALWFGNANTAISSLANVLMLWIGAGMVMDGTFTVGMLFAFTSFGGQFGSRMSSLIEKAIEFKMLSMHAERLADIVLEAPEEDPETTFDALHLTPRIELVDVGFRYGDGEPWVLRHVNLTIEPGDAVAIVGPSGGGKTTLVKLILSVLTPCEGEIRFGGVPIKQLGARAYRLALAAVMQDDQLLAGSLRDNISFFDQNPDQAHLERCALLAAVHGDISAMPMGYETLTGDMGTTLSGGQKQRVLLARALYKKPRVLILDEATSHLDIPKEREVNAAIAALEVTRIIVAHRQETIASARRIIALVDGSIVAAPLP
jgi:ATP-binding cassette subfamily B protein RaxB